MLPTRKRAPLSLRSRSAPAPLPLRPRSAVARTPDTDGRAVQARGRSWVVQWGTRGFAALNTAGWSQTAIRPRSIQYPLDAHGLLHPLHPPTSRQQEEATPLCPSANSSAPHAQQIPKPVALVLRCRAEMVMIVEVKTWSRRPVLRTGAAGAPTRKETAGPHSACVVRSRRRHVHLQRRRAGDRPAMPRRVEAHPSPFLRLRQRSHPAPWCGHTRQILEDKEEFQVT